MPGGKKRIFFTFNLNEFKESEIIAKRHKALTPADSKVLSINELIEQIKVGDAYLALPPIPSCISACQWYEKVLFDLDATKPPANTDHLILWKMAHIGRARSYLTTINTLDLKYSDVFDFLEQAKISLCYLSSINLENEEKITIRDLWGKLCVLHGKLTALFISSKQINYVYWHHAQSLYAYNFAASWSPEYSQMYRFLQNAFLSFCQDSGIKIVRPEIVKSPITVILSSPSLEASANPNSFYPRQQHSLDLKRTVECRRVDDKSFSSDKTL